VGVLRQVSGYPIQPSKVQRPPLRDDVLSRSRLNDLLDAKSSHRVVLVVAEPATARPRCSRTGRVGPRAACSGIASTRTIATGWASCTTSSRPGRVLDERFGHRDRGSSSASLGPDGPDRDQIVASLARGVVFRGRLGVT
jgi:hypothetical protein